VSSRSPTPEDHSSRSSTPEENRPSGNGGENDKSSKDDRYKERYRYLIRKYLSLKILFYFIFKR